MDDPEPFVVSRVFHGLIDNRIDVAADRLEKAADKHPELAADMISLLLGRWHSTSPQDIAVLRTFFKKPRSRRAVGNSGRTDGDHAEEFSEEIVASLGDQSAEVRTAAANMVFKSGAIRFWKRHDPNASNSSLGEVDVSR